MKDNQTSPSSPQPENETMGDHRAQVKIEFTFHGETSEMDAYINWSQDGGRPDYRVCEFFEQAYDAGMVRYRQMIYESQKEEREKVQEEKDRADFERLKAKYESPAPDA